MLTWNDTEEIAEALEAQYPGTDVLSLRFTLLKKMISELEDFGDDMEKCNEKKLEVIQAAWLELRD